MKRRQTFFALLLGGLMAASPAFARSLAENIARQLSGQGFSNVQIEGTWLGRSRITGTRNGESREIVVNPNTGEILRDLWLNDKGQVRAAEIDVEDDGTDDSSDSDKGEGEGGKDSDGDSGDGDGDGDGD